MRKKILPILALCAITASPVSAIKFCPYTACMAVIGMLEVARMQAPEYARPLRGLQAAAAVVFTGLGVKFLWNVFSATHDPNEVQAAKDETQSHS